MSSCLIAHLLVIYQEKSWSIAHLCVTKHRPDICLYIYIYLYVLIYISIYHIGWLDDFRPLTVATATRVTYQTVSSQATLFSRALLAVNMRNNSAKPGKYGYVQEGCHVFCFLRFQPIFNISAIQIGAQYE